MTLILGRLDEFASRIKHGLHEADWSTRREIIRAVVKRVDIDQEHVRVIFRVNPPPQAPQLPSEKDTQSLQHCGGRDNAALWNSTERLVVGPVFHVSCIEKFLHEFDKSSVVNMFFEHVNEQFMIELLKAVCNISLDKPGDSSPMVVDFSQCRVTSTFGAKSMRVV